MIDFDTIKELFKESIDESNTMNEALQRLFDKVYDKGKFDATDEQLLRQKIAQEVTDKMVYMDVCPNAQDAIISIIKNQSNNAKLHCDECWQIDCQTKQSMT